VAVLVAGEVAQLMLGIEDEDKIALGASFDWKGIGQVVFKRCRLSQKRKEDLLLEAFLLAQSLIRQHETAFLRLNEALLDGPLDGTQIAKIIESSGRSEDQQLSA